MSGSPAIAAVQPPKRARKTGPGDHGAQALLVDVVVDDEHRAAWAALGDLEHLVQQAALAVAGSAKLDFGRVDAAIALSVDREVKALNGTYRGQYKPTNVLSFPSGPPTPSFVSDDDGAVGARFIGDVIIAAETVEREAVALGIPRAHHLQHLVIHGLLHLLGYDHELDGEAERMEALETEILSTLGIADPYRDEPSHTLTTP